MSLVGYSQNRIETPYFFIQISDTQFGMFTNNREFSKETELYEAAVQKINRLKPDFVIITGDLVNKPSDTLQITEFKRITAQFDNAIPVHFVPGNHDVNLIPDSLSLRFFEENQGPDKFSFEHKGSRFIGINSSIIKAKVPVFEQQQKTWLEQVNTMIIL
jgi:3',5'-cyclic AMP phosphodiesterase CpdA